MTTILLPTHRTAAPGEEQSVWGDLRVALSSIAAYASDVDVVVGWDGTEKPAGLPDNPRVRVLERPKALNTASEGWNWCATQTDDPDLIIMNDDAVFTPDSVRFLMEDVALLKSHPEGIAVGLVGMRSNYIKGPQNIRRPNGGEMTGVGFATENEILEVDMAVPVVAYVDQEAYWKVGGFPPTNWFGDDILCWELRRLGYRHFVSRAYCHHVGQRGTGQHKSSDVLLAEGLSWLRNHRPDFLRTLGYA